MRRLSRVEAQGKVIAASLTAIESEVIGECVEKIRIEVGRRGIGDCFGVS